MKTTRLLTILTAFMLLPIYSNAQCDLITINGSTQMPNGICVPVTFGMEAHFEFLIPVDTSLVQILYRWNDASNTETYVSGNWNAAGDSIWSTATHIYPPDNECSKTAEAIVVYDGQLCESSGYQSQIFATWGTDEENSGELIIEPIVHYVCEGVDIVDFTFDDNSIFNCNINIENDRPNRLDRWVQFSYNTYSQSGNRIPDVTVRDSIGINLSMTDTAGNFAGNLNGAIIHIPYPADGPTETSYEISAPAGGVAGDIFEITLRNWNICNPYDNNPNDALPPADLINGDNPAIITQGRIEIIAPTPIVVPALFEFCTGNNIILSATAGTAEIRWYSNSSLDTLLYIGANFNPTLAPASIDPNTPGSYSFYVTSFQGICESAAGRVDLEIYQTPAPSFAGSDKTVCYDTITLHANTPSAGVGVWTTTSSAIIANAHNAITKVTDLEFDSNEFTWSISNGVCVTSDKVIIYSDRQALPANAGIDQYICDIDSVLLSATPPTSLGNGIWNIISGTGSLSDSSLPNSLFIGASHDTNILAWRVSSRFSSCPVTIDTIKIVADYSAGIANAGIDVYVCEDSIINLSGNNPINNGNAYWQIFSGIGNLTDSASVNSSVNSIDYGLTKLIWNLNSKFNICPLSSDTLKIIRDQSPGIANAGIDKAYCLETQDTLLSNPPLFGTGIWNVIGNPSAVPPTFSPNNSISNPLFSVMPGNEGAYTLEWLLVNGSCISRDTVTLDFGIPVPQANAGRDTVACGYDYMMNGNSINIGKGTWSVLSGIGSVIFNPNNSTPKTIATFLPGSEGIYSFEWRFTSGSCPPTSDTVNIEITTAPIPPVFTDLQSCGSDTFSISVPTGNARNIAYWYISDTTTIHFFKGNVYETAVLNNTTNYYIKLRDTISTCESPRSKISIVIDEVPPLPILVGDTLCKPGQGILSGMPLAPANTVLWYANPELLAIDTSNILLVDTLSTTQYFFGRGLNTLNGCYSKIDSVLALVHEIIPSPIVFNDSACGSSSFLLKAQKTLPTNSLFWYDANNSFINIGDSLLTATIDTTTVFYVAEYNPITKCLSEQSELQILIHSIPAIPEFADTSSCGAAFFILNPNSGSQANTFRWYNAPVVGNMIAESDSFQTPLLNANTSYWISAFNPTTKCESNREQLSISIFPSPAAIDILGPTLVLKDQTDVVFFTVNGQAGSTYTWDIPTDILVEANMNDFVRLAFPNKSTYTISVFETTVNSCIGAPVFHNITVIEDSIALDIGNYEQGACTTDIFEIKPWLFGGTPPYIYQWTGDTEYLSTTNTLFTSFTPPGVGQFKLYLELVDVNLKIAYDSVLITVYESPITSILNTDTVACVGENFEINTSNSGNEPFTYLWSGPIHRLNSYSVANPIYVPHSIDTVQYYYILRDANNCKAYDSITIISDEPLASFNILTDPGCSPLNVSFENTSENSVKYNWQFGELGSSTDKSPNFEFINTSPEIKYVEVKLEVESPLACTSDALKYAMVWPNPNADIMALPQTACTPAQTLLVSSPGNRFYRWSFGDESSDTITGAFSIYHTYTNNSFIDKNYTARVITESSLNCTDTAYINLSVYPKPKADFEINPSELTFPENSFKLNNLTAGDWNFTWNYGDGTASSQVQPGKKDYEEPGIYTISLSASGEHCSDSISKIVRLFPAPPVAEFKGADNGCMPHTVTLINSSKYASSYLWDFGDGNISTAKNPSYTYYESGVYKIKLKVSGFGGESVYSDTTRVYIIPNSFFELAPRYVYVNDEAVHYFNLSDNASVFEWDFGDGNTSTEWNPKHVYKQEGNYAVTLKVWTENSCFDLYVMENAVLVEPSGIVEYPNAFRPNSSIEENRVFMPGVIDHVEKYHLMIFNRWGELIFESFDQEIGWDGYYRGEIAKQDVYVYKVKGNYSDGKGFTKTGNVTLLY